MFEMSLPVKSLCVMTRSKPDPIACDNTIESSTDCTSVDGSQLGTVQSECMGRRGDIGRMTDDICGGDGQVCTGENVDSAFDDLPDLVESDPEMDRIEPPTPHRSVGFRDLPRASSAMCTQVRDIQYYTKHRRAGLFQLTQDWTAFKAVIIANPVGGDRLGFLVLTIQSGCNVVVTPVAEATRENCLPYTIRSERAIVDQIYRKQKNGTFITMDACICKSSTSGVSQYVQINSRSMKIDMNINSSDPHGYGIFMQPSVMECIKVAEWIMDDDEDDPDEISDASDAEECEEKKCDGGYDTDESDLHDNGNTHIGQNVTLMDVGHSGKSTHQFTLCIDIASGNKNIRRAA